MKYDVVIRRTDGYEYRISFNYDFRRAQRYLKIALIRKFDAWIEVMK